VILARVTKLEEAQIELGDEPDILVQRTDPRDIVIDIADRVKEQAGRATPNEAIRGTITGAPDCIHLAITHSRVSRWCPGVQGMPADATRPVRTQNPTVITYQGSGSTAAVNVKASRLESLPDKDVIVALNGLPTYLESSLYANGSVNVETSGGALGLAEVRLTTGPTDDNLPGDGVLVRDRLAQTARDTYVPERSVVFARATNVHYVRFDKGIDGDFTADADTDAVTPFDIVVERDKAPNPGHVCFPLTTTCIDFPPVPTYLRAHASDLQRNTNVQMDSSTGATKIRYSADTEIPTPAGGKAFTIDTNLTGSLNFHADATTLARNLQICLHAPKGSLGGDTYPCGLHGVPTGGELPNGPTVVATAAAPVDANNPMTINVLDCKKRDHNGGCGNDIEGNGIVPEYLRVDGLQFRGVRFQSHTLPSGDTWLYVDTNHTSAVTDLASTPGVQGSLVSRVANAEKPDKIFATFGGLRATQRRVLVATALAGLGAPVQSREPGTMPSGMIDCPPPFDMFAVDNSFIGSLRLPLCFDPMRAVVSL
jgi:hypothetical protein